MTPDIEPCALYRCGLLRATRLRRPAAIHIADRVPRAAYPVVDAFARFLEIIPTRLSAPDVLDFLSTKVVRERFAIAAEELPTIERWIAQCNIRWASDAAHREFEGQGRSDLNTWRFGLRRLFLGSKRRISLHSICARMNTSDGNTRRAFDFAVSASRGIGSQGIDVACVGRAQTADPKAKRPRHGGEAASAWTMTATGRFTME